MQLIQRKIKVYLKTSVALLKESEIKSIGKMKLWDKYFRDIEFRKKINKLADEMILTHPFKLVQVTISQDTLHFIKPIKFKDRILEYSKER